jgi:hypothetical protein
MDPDPDQDQSIKMDPDQDHIDTGNHIRIRINLQMTSQNIWNISLYEHFFMVFKPLFGSWDQDPAPDPHESIN